MLNKSSEENINPKTLYWLVEPNTEILDFEVLEYVPKDYDSQYEHVWKWNSNNYGGVRLLSRKFAKGLKEINPSCMQEKFDILDSFNTKIILIYIHTQLMYGV